MSTEIHEPILYRPEGDSRHTLPAEICGACSDLAMGVLIPASFCDEAKARMGPAPWEPPMPPCPKCRSTNRKPYDIKPPHQHPGPCTPACTIRTLLCLNCRFAA